MCLNASSCKRTAGPTGPAFFFFSLLNFVYLLKELFYARLHHFKYGKRSNHNKHAYNSPEYMLLTIVYPLSSLSRREATHKLNNTPGKH